MVPAVAAPLDTTGTSGVESASNAVGTVLIATTGTPAMLAQMALKPGKVSADA